MRWNWTSGEVATTKSKLSRLPSSVRSAMRSPCRSIERTWVRSRISTPRSRRCRSKASIRERYPCSRQPLTSAPVVTSYSNNLMAAMRFPKRLVSRSYRLILNALFLKGIRYYNGLTIYPVEYLRQTSIGAHTQRSA